MICPVSMYKGFRFPPEIISHCVWLYHRFPLSFREIELMAERDVCQRSLNSGSAPLSVIDFESISR